MSSNSSRAAKTWSDNRHDTLRGREVAIESIDGVAVAHRRPVLVPRPDSNAQRIPSIGPESTRGVPFLRLTARAKTPGGQNTALGKND